MSPKMAAYKGVTGGKGDWSIVYLEAFNQKILAMNREREIKSCKNRKVIEGLVSTLPSMNLNHLMSEEFSTC